METKARWLVMLLGLLALGAADAPAQGRMLMEVRPEAGGRPRLDYFVSRYRPEQSGSPGEDAVGGRLMWSMASVMPHHGSWADRTAVGAYVVHSPEAGSGAEVWRYGLQTDVKLLPDAVGRLEPLASLGLGAYRREEYRPSAAALPLAPPPMARSVDTSWSLAPGMGVRLRLAPGIAVRGDARQVIDFQGGPRRNLELSGGVSVGG